MDRCRARGDTRCEEATTTNGGTMRRLLFLAPLALAAAGLVAGSSLAAPVSGWTINDLGTLGGQYKDCVAAAVNEQGQVAGGCGDARGRQHAFLWQRGKLTYLGTLGG